jgi:hypothetical protein
MLENPRSLVSDDGQFEGLAIPVRPGFEQRAVTMIRTVLDRLASEAGGGNDRQAKIGVFVDYDTIKNITSDGTYDSFFLLLLDELKRVRGNTGHAI